jgi:hypothetical protein
MADKKKSETDPDIIPPERNEKAQAKSQTQTIEAQPRRRVTSSLVLAALLLVLLGMVMLRFDLVSLPQFDFSLSDALRAEAPASDAANESQAAEGASAVASDPVAEMPAAEPAAPADDASVDDAPPAPSPASDVTRAGVRKNVFPQALLLLRAGEALSSVWDDLQMVLPAAALDPLRNDYDQPASARDQLMLQIADWWSARAPSQAARLDTSLPAVIDSLLNAMITIRPHNPGDRVAESFRQLVARGDITGALGQWDGLSLADQQSLAAWHQAAKTYQARQALKRLIQDQM